MANEIQELINEIGDERLKARLSAAIGELRKTKKFGLVFEEHIPELLPIYSAKIRSKARVARKNGRLTETFVVQRVAKGVAIVEPELGEGEPQSIPVAELVVVKRFGEAIFPALRQVESVLRGGNAPHHTLIEADNYHALQLLEWLYAGKVDCIYIDPPYNTGARDWKYNNDYVDGNDSWRHSKWLAFMERRIKLARRLLKLDTGILIVTIDEHEVHHLGMLLEKLLPETTRQLVTIVSNPKGNTQGRFSRVEEYALFCFMPEAMVFPQPDDLLTNSSIIGSKDVRWANLLRSGSNSQRKDRQGLFFPVLIDKKRQAVVGAGGPLPLSQAPDFDKKISGYTPVWPVRSDGSLGNWSVGPESLRTLIKKGYTTLGGYDSDRNTYSISYLNRKPQKQIESGVIKVASFDRERNSVLVEYVESAQRQPKTVWYRTTHDAGSNGSDLLTSILGRAKAFSYPKSVYAVRDAISAVVGNRQDALVLDFFAGSGTTLDAINLLNAIDNGRRRCILVTNNEVSAEDAGVLRNQDLTPGMNEWEARGICRSVTFPRCKFVINGHRIDGTQLPGEYLTGRFEEQEIRRTIRPLDFATVETLASKKAREALALAVGFTKSKVTGVETFLLGEGEMVAVLLDPDQLAEFIEQGEEWAESIETVYLPFQSGTAFNQAKVQLVEAWPPLTRSVEIKRPMKDGFAANLDYFQLNFLDRSLVESGGKLADLLPALWMMAGCRGKLPTCTGREDMLFPKDCPFAVLVQEYAFKPFLAELKKHPKIDWVFLITNDQDSFSRMAQRLPEQLPATQRVHLWRNYLDNFVINVDREAL